MEVFYTMGTCARQIVFTIDDNDELVDLRFVGGCAGNLQGISKLAVGMHIDRIIEKLSGIICKGNTSCPDQLSKALSGYKRKKEEAASLSPTEADKNKKK